MKFYDIKQIAKDYDLLEFWSLVQTKNPAANKPYHNNYHIMCVVKYCYEMAKDRDLSWEGTRLLLLAAMYHDFGHFSSNDYLNIIKAKQIVQVHAYRVNPDLEKKITLSDLQTVESIIAATQYPYVIDGDRLTIYQQIIRDADLLQWTEDTCIQHNLKGLAEEMEIPVVEFIPKYQLFILAMQFYTDWAKARYAKYRDIRFLQIDEFAKKITPKPMHKRLILVARAASGKDFLRNKLTEKGFKPSISITTRPPRDGEVDGKDYIFLSDEKVAEMIANDEFYEYVTFNGWIYGTTKDQFQIDDTFIMTPKGLSHVTEEDRKNSFVIYLDIPEETRRQRLLLRAMPGDTTERRLEADNLDFKDFKDYDLRITNPDF